MKTVSEHIAHIKGKPHHIRKKVAFTSAAAAAGFIALTWLIGNLSSGSFAIEGSTFAESAGGERAVVVGESEGASSLAGAAAALGEDAPAHIEIVDTSPAPSVQAEQTTIPF